MAKTIKTRVLDFGLPHRGIHLGTANHEIPDGYTASVNNMIPLDSTQRRRIGKRPGLSKCFNGIRFGDTAAGKVAFQHASLAMHTDQSAGTSGMYVITVSGGRTYRQSVGSTSLTRIDGGSAAFSPGRKVAGFTAFNKTYLTDGLVNMVYDPNGSGAGVPSWATWVGTTNGGAFPVAGGEYPRQAVYWRGRAVLTQLDKGIPSTIFFSKQGDPTDFFYGATYTPIIAIATDNNFRAGQLGDQTTCLISINEDILLVSTDHSLHEFVGDPADGGTLVPISESVGILSDTAYCVVDDTVYFVGTGGFYKYSRSGGVQNLSMGAWNINFIGLPQTGKYYALAHGRDLHGIWVFITQQLGAYTEPTTKHFFYDLATQSAVEPGGFWPQSFPTATGGDNEVDTAGSNGTTAPAFHITKALSVDGTASTDTAQLVFVFCKDGYVRKFLSTNLNDDSTAISTTIDMGTLQPTDGMNQVMLNGALVVMGEQSNLAATYQFRTGNNPYLAYNTPAATNGGSITVGGRQTRLGTRLAGNTFLCRFSDSTVSKTMVLERVSGIFQIAGLAR